MDTRTPSPPGRKSQIVLPDGCRAAETTAAVECAFGQPEADSPPSPPEASSTDPPDADAKPRPEPSTPATPPPAAPLEPDARAEEDSAYARADFSTESSYAIPTILLEGAPLATWTMAAYPPADDPFHAPYPPTLSMILQRPVWGTPLYTQMMGVYLTDCGFVVEPFPLRGAPPLQVAPPGAHQSWMGVSPPPAAYLWPLLPPIPEYSMPDSPVAMTSNLSLTNSTMAPMSPMPMAGPVVPAAPLPAAEEAYSPADDDGPYLDTPAEFPPMADLSTTNPPPEFPPSVLYVFETPELAAQLCVHCRAHANVEVDEQGACVGVFCKSCCTKLANQPEFGCECSRPLFLDALACPGGPVCTVCHRRAREAGRLKRREAASPKKAGAQTGARRRGSRGGARRIRHDNN